MKKRHVFWTGCAIFGLAIGLPFGWGFSQFHPSDEHQRASSNAQHAQTTPNATGETNKREPTPQQHDGRDWWGPHAFLVYVTVPLVIFTGLLFKSTRDLARASNVNSREALDASTKATKTLIRIERAYLTGGGDVGKRAGRNHFRVEVANYGKTAAYLTSYEIKFAAKLADLQGTIYDPDKDKSQIFDDRIAPDNETKVIGYVEMVPPNAEIIYGCFWYTDWRKKEQFFRFILRVEPFTGSTRTDVGSVDDSYRKWT